MSKQLILLSLFFTLLTGAVYAQDSTQLKSNFPDGLYFTYANFIAGEPDLKWDEISGEMVQLPEDFRLQVADFRLKGSDTAPTIYAVCLDGFPYLFVKEDQQLNYHEFAGLRLNGRYRYYEYTGKVKTDNVMYAYNPANGRPFRQGRVQREKNVLHQFVLDLATGKTRVFDRPGVSEIVETDSDLLRAVTILKPEDRELGLKLLQAIRIYNQRYPSQFNLPE